MPSKRTILRVCNQCKCNFFIRSSYIKEGHGLYCSMTCRSKSQTKPLQDRFWLKVQKSEGCWEWLGSCNIGGYGTIRVNEHSCLAHRISYELENGPFDTTLCVCHSCDNRKCVRPSHLFLGTYKDNVHDCINKNRRGTKSGEALSFSKLKESDVLEILHLRKEGLTGTELSIMFNISRQTIYEIWEGKRWKHVPR